jgi:ribosomal-protein-alanine N-acetyltransferase
MTADIQFEPLKEENINDIVILEKLSFKDPWTRQSFYDELVNPLAHYILAKNSENVVGYGGFWKILDEAHITNIAVHPEYRRKNVGKNLMRQLILKAKDMQLTKMTLEVRQSNQVAISMYEKFGFVFCGLRPRYYADGENARIYWLEL